MKYLLAIFISIWFFTAFAKMDSNFEIPVSQDDYVPVDQPIRSHHQYRVKLYKCLDGEYGILYRSYWGWSRGSKFAGFCKWENRVSIESCQADEDPATSECYKKYLKEFQNQN